MGKLIKEILNITKQGGLVASSGFQEVISFSQRLPDRHPGNTLLLAQHPFGPPCVKLSHSGVGQHIRALKIDEAICEFLDA